MFSDNVANFALMMQAAGGQRPPPPPSRPHPNEQVRHTRRPTPRQHGASPHPAYAGSGFGDNFGHSGSSTSSHAAPMTAQQQSHNPIHASMQSFQTHHYAPQGQAQSRPEHHAAYSHNMHQSQWAHHPNSSPNFALSRDQQQQQQQQQRQPQWNQQTPHQHHQRQSSPRKPQNRAKNGGGDRGGGSGKRSSKPKARKQASKRDNAGSGTVKVPNSLLQLIPPKYRTVHSMGSSPEEIKQWREARRRNYPTVQNVQAKLKSQADLVSAGALSADRNGSHHHHHHHKPSPDERRAAAASKKADEPSAVESHHGQKEAVVVVDSVPRQTEQANDNSASSSFPAVPASASSEVVPAGLSGLLAYSDDESDDDSDNEDGRRKETEGMDVTAREKTANAAAACPSDAVAKEPLAHSRGADTTISVRSENPKDNVKDTRDYDAAVRDTSSRPQNSSTKRPSKQKRQRQCDFFLRGACTHGDRCRYVHDPDARVNAARKKRIAVLRREKAVREQSLLFQLVKPEISEERNIMLQCIRFLVQNNFLQPPQQQQKAGRD